MSDPELTKRAAPRDKEGDDGEAQPAFRVIDRRRFAADGSEKDAAETSDPDAAQAAGEPQKPATVAPPPPQPPPVQPRQGEGFVMADEASAHGTAHDLPEPSFSTLLISLSTQALMHLGEIPDLATGAHEKDLPAAKSIIDILAVLERKTTGNLDAGESSLLERILYDLRMRFVEVARS